jgi:hypothetical protein
VSIIAALYDPLTILLAHDLSNVMSPNNDCTNVGATSIRSIVSPRAGKIVRRAWIAANL